MSEDLYWIDNGDYSGSEALKAIEEKNERWLVVIDRGDGKETRIHEGDDINKVYTRIGQMVLSLGVDQIIVYRNGEEYRRYELKRQNRCDYDKEDEEA